ncbi:MAG: fibronectin-binding domain-containing protein [Candidatus Nitrosotenuis sp.]|nr:MAG: fibronectin-binding domain-containing protein [Candidatus Nitrosotenuis sp.]
MTLAGIELRYLVNEISKTTDGYYVSNIYGINRESLLFKLHHPEKPDLFLVLSTIGMWLTNIKIDQIEDNKLVKRLRDDLARLKITKIEQIEVERIAYLTFSGFDKEFVLICEFFGDGNIILCNKQMKILALLHSIEVRHRELHVGVTYTPPPLNGLNVFEINEKDFQEISSVSTPVIKWVGRTLGLPAKYAEEIISIAKIDPNTPGRDLTNENITAIIDATNNLVHKVASGDHQPFIVKTEKGFDVYPIQISAAQNQEHTEIPTFMEGLDKIFSEMLLDGGKIAHSSSLDKKIDELQSKIDEQDKAILLVKERSESITKIAKSLFEFPSRGITSITDPYAIEKLREQNAELVKEKGLVYIKIGDEKVQIKSDSSIPAIASTLFDESKRQSSATESIEFLKRKNQKEIQRLRAQIDTAKEYVTYTQVQKKNWYERYRWFYTSDGLLAIGGRDSSSNSAIIRKHLGKNDKVFHAEIFGSPFFILKDTTDPIPFDSLNEVAHATVCFSRAWREAMYGMSAYWINPDQVKKAAPSGQFLTRGSFVLEGQKNFVKISTLRLAVGILKENNYHMITCGPLEPIKKKCICYAVIEPGGAEMADTAKKIRSDFVRVQEDIVARFTVDDFVRVLPAGTSHVTEVVQKKDEQ